MTRNISKVVRNEWKFKYGAESQEQEHVIIDLNLIKLDYFNNLINEIMFTLIQLIITLPPIYKVPYSYVK